MRKSIRCFKIVIIIVIDYTFQKCLPFSKCWINYGNYIDVLAVPVILVMVSNVVILISVIVTITRKRAIRRSEDRYTFPFQIYIS